MGEEPRASGSGLLNLRDLLRETAGKQGYARALETLASDVREEWTAMTALSWVRLSTSATVIDAVAAQLDEDPMTLHEYVVRGATERSFKTIHRVLLHFTSDDALIARTPMMYSKNRNVGRLSARIAKPGNGILTLSDWPEITERNARSLAVGIVTVIQLSGRRNVRWSWSRTPDGALFDMTWDV